MDRRRLADFFKNRTTRIVLVCLGALLLLLAVWKVFFGKSGSSYEPTAQEARLCKLLEDVEGVDHVTAMISEEDGVPVGAIVIFRGADSILTRLRVLEITAQALNLQKKCVQVYPASA